MANNNYWWHRYGYTDFHELDLTWILTQVQELLSTVETLEVRVEQCETAIEELDSRLDTAEDKIMVLESDMDTAQDDITGLKNRVTAIEGADIMDATMLKEVASVVPSNANVGISFTKDTYVDGVKSTTTDSATIPSATTTNAGVMLPAEKSKLNAFSVDGSGNATFTGTVAGSDPSTSAQFATKSYVDSLAITGSASVAYDSDATQTTWHEFGVTETGLGYVRAYTYGKVAQLRGFVYKELENDHVAGTECFTCKLKTDYDMTFSFDTFMLKEGTHELVPVKVQIDVQHNLSILAYDALQAGDTLSCNFTFTGLIVS